MSSLRLKIKCGFEEASRNALLKNHSKTIDMLRNGMREIMRRYAQAAVISAVENYSQDPNNSNLTGNTISGFCAAVYYNGKTTEADIVRAIDEVGRLYSYYYAKPGDSGFADYDTGELIGTATNPSVRDYAEDRGYSWVNHESKGHGYLDTTAFLLSHKPEITKGFAVVVANASPYVEFLQTVRNFEILEKTNMDARRDFIGQLHNLLVVG